MNAETEKLLDEYHAKALAIANKLAAARAEIERLKGEILHIRSQMCSLQDQRDGYRAGNERLRGEIGKAYKEGWTEGFACDGHAVYGFEGQRDMDFEKSNAKRVVEGLK